MSRRTIEWKLHLTRSETHGDDRIAMVYTGINHKIREFLTEEDHLSVKGLWWYIEGDVTMCVLLGESEAPAFAWWDAT